MEFDNLSAKQLKQVISNASSALNRRQKVAKALAEINRVSRKYKLSKKELKTVLSSIQASEGGSSPKSRSASAKVKPKYQSPNGEKFWTGRGRTPSWVLEICDSEGLTVAEYKSDTRFLIPNAISKKASVGR